VAGRKRIKSREKKMEKKNSEFLKGLKTEAMGYVPKLRWEALNKKEHQLWRGKFRKELGSLVGRMPEKVPLRYRIAEKKDKGKFIRQKVYIQSEKNYWVPAYYFLPKNLQKKVPAIVCLHGHSGILPYIREGTALEKEKSIDHCLDYAPFFAEHGYVTIAPVQRGWNETTAGIPGNEKGCDRLTLDSFLLGMTPVGLRCWDASRVLDFLCLQKEVDSSKIGAAGLSGGGMVALFWTALEKRLGLSMVAGYYCTFFDSVFSIHHCICNCVPGIMEWGDMCEVAALAAPRPMLIISGTMDTIFPIQATRKAYNRLAGVYSLLNAEENLESDFFRGPHAWSNRKTLSFLRKHFGS
jgi:dienelactone hydrolase